MDNPRIVIISNFAPRDEVKNWPLVLPPRPYFSSKKKSLSLMSGRSRDFFISRLGYDMMGRFHTINILSMGSRNLTWTFMADHLEASISIGGRKNTFRKKLSGKKRTFWK
jgi:hypothetical protein